MVARCFRTAIAALVIGAFLPVAAMAQAQTGTLSGTVRTGEGVTVAGATVLVSGPQSARTVSDNAGAFTVAGLTPGIYHVDVSKGGFVPAGIDDVVVFAGETQSLGVTLVQADLSSLRTIATVRSSSGKSAINTGAAATDFVSNADLQNLASPQINTVLARVPGANIQKLGSQPNTSISLAGAQPYETQVLLDGHPLSAGRYGVWFSQFLNPALVSTIETQTGPGNTTPFAGTAVGGTANIVTPGFTKAQTAEFTLGTDSFGSQYDSFIASGSASKLDYVVAWGYGSSNGPYYQQGHCVVTPSNTALDNKPGSTGIIQYCGDSSGSLYTKGELFKFRYNFSQATSFEAGFVGSQGGYLPQGSSYGTYLGTTTIVQCLPSSPTHCTNPNYQAYVGNAIDAYQWYPGSNVHYNQPLFSGQLVTSVGRDTLLVRPYLGNITRIVDGLGETLYPNYYYPNGTPSPCAGASGESLNGYTECYNTQYTTAEFDKLQGTTFSYLHPVGDNLFTLTYDYHSDNTYAYVLPGTSVVVPDTTERYDTLSFTGSVSAARNLKANFGLYDTTWKLFGQTPIGTGPSPTTLVSLNRTVSRLDPHVALVFEPLGGISYRAAYGTSATFPYASQVSGTASIIQGGASLNFLNYLQAKNPYLNPEVSSTFDFGADKRFHNGSVLSVDYQTGVIHDVFETLSTPVVGNPDYSLASEPLNVARLKNSFLTARYAYAPLVGIGYTGTFALQSSIPSGLPAEFYSTSPSLPANGQQQCGVSIPGGQICIPYMTGYGEVNYTTKYGVYAALGTQFQGKNNTYNQPPFWQWSLTLRDPISKVVDAQISVENLLNTNNFYNLPMPNSGVPVVSETSAGLSQMMTSLIPANPRTVRFQLRWHFNR